MSALSDVPAVPPRLKRILAPIREVGDIGGFSASALAALPGAARYVAEVLRQCGVLILGSTIVLLALQMVIGAECGLFVVYLTRPLGATSAVGQLQVPCSIREVFPYMFSYIFAAKVGAGLVAEIGSMRISSEIDALEASGIDPMKYLIGTRLLAIIICVPMLYIVSMVTGLAGGYLAAAVQLGDLSGAQYLNGYFSAQSLTDNVDSIVKAVSICFGVAFVSLYYGYRASHGPVGVGNAVARAMMVNLVLINVAGGFWSAVFWGTNAGYPGGG
jgi:phospholipid/cholesterol/gamma-HCH transport system permease protein